MTTKSVFPRASIFSLTTLAGFLAIAALAPMSANALGLGDIRVSSPSGQPLKAEVDLVIDNRQEALNLVIRNGSAEDYAREGLGPRGALASLRVAVQQRGKKYVAVLTTREPMNDAFAYIVLEGSAGNGHVMRSYPVLLRVESLGQLPAKEMVFERSLQGPITADSLPDDAQPAANASVALTVGSATEDNATRHYENLIEIGKRPKAKKLHRVSGAGKLEPVGQALFRIVPKGWKGFAGEVDVRSIPPINWAARNDYWISVLDGVMSQTSLTATVNWPAKEVTFRGLELPTKKHVTVASPAEPVAATVRSEPSPVTKLSPEELEKAHVRIAALKARLAYLEEREAAQKAAKASSAPVAKVESNGSGTPGTGIVVVATIQPLNAAIRNILPSNYLLLTNNQSAFQRLRVKSVSVDGDWQARAKELVTSLGGTLRIDHEKQRVFISLTS